MAIPFLKGIDVAGTVDLSNLTIDSAQGTDGQVLTSTGSGIAWEDASGGASLSGGAANKLAIWSGTDTLTNDTNLHWDTSNDRLGIGTPTPGSMLHLKSAGDVKLILEADSDNSGENDNPLIELKQDGGGIVSRFGNVGDAGQIFTNSRANSTGLGSVYQQDLILFTENSARVYIKGENGYQGRVGIGKALPSQTLDVNGNVAANRYYGNSNTTYYVDPNDTSQAAYLAGDIRITDAIATIKLDTTNIYPSSRIIVTKNGSESPSMGGISWASNPSFEGSIWNQRLTSSPYTESSIKLPTSSSYNFVINTLGSDRMVIDSSGNVGIGTNNPAAKLDVDGTAKADEFVSLVNTSNSGITRDWTLIGTGDRGAALEIADISGAKYAIYAGGYDLTFGKHVSSNNTYTTAMAIYAANATDASPYVQAAHSFRAPIFYDSNNTGYYVNPNGDSKIVGLKLEPGSGNNVSGGDSTIWVYRENNNDWGIQVDANQSSATDYGFEFQGGASHSYAFRATKANSEYFRVGTDTLYHTAQMQAPIFYDYNNTNYYLNPADSNLSLKAYGEICNSNYAEGNLNAGSLNIGRTDTNYVFGGVSNWPSDVRLGILANCANDWEFGIHDSGTSVESVFLYQNSSGLITMGRDLGWGSTPIVASSSFRAPIFYDSNNTGYYLDPASSGTALKINGIINQDFEASNLNTAWTTPGSSHHQGFIVGRYSGSAANRPHHNDNANWFANIYSHNSGGTASYGIQLAGSNASSGENSLSLRTVSNGSFSSWRKVYHEGHKPTYSELGTMAYSNLTGTPSSLPANGGNSDTVDNLHATSFLRSDANDTFTGKLSVGDTNIRRAGIYGIYDSYRIGHIWSMGTGYNIANDGSDFGNLYGLAYKHTNNTTGGTMGNSHQMVWCNNGSPRGSIGYSSVWHAESMKAPIFYDSNDTNYKLDPNGTSNLNHLNVAGTFRFQRSSYTQTGQDDNVSVTVGDSDITFRHNNDDDGDASVYNFQYRSGGNDVDILNFASSYAAFNTPYVRCRNNSTDYAQLESNSSGGVLKAVSNGATNVLFRSYGDSYTLNDFGVGTSLPTARLHVEGTTSTTSSGVVRLKSLTSSNGPYIRIIDFIRSNNSLRGYIALNPYAVQYSTSSDYRLKRNVTPMENSIDRIKLLKPSRFNWVEGPDDYVVDGFIAHEVQDVVHDAVSGEKDAVDENNEPAYQGIDQSKLVPLLTAALQDAITKIENLETRIQILENQ